jgi:predicted PolB exonuclease-like 3'-5' exonuclease
VPATLVFDIETVPDVAGCRTVFELDPSLADADVAEVAFQRRRAASGQDFLPLHLQRVVAIACLLRDRDQLRVWSLGAPADGEGELIQRFYDGIDKYTPQLVSWNGSGFDLPVLHYRGLVHGVAAPRYWDLGDGDFADSRDFRHNNYIGRYHTRHVDLMDLLARYQSRASAPLDQLARLLGFPGKLGLDGSQVWDAFREGRIDDIRRYCETDVFNTWLVYLRFQVMRGAFDRDECRREFALARATIASLDEPHWREFLARWLDSGQ